MYRRRQPSRSHLARVRTLSLPPHQLPTASRYLTSLTVASGTFSLGYSVFKISWCVVSRTPDRGVVDTCTSCVVGRHQIVWMSAVCLSVGFPPVLSLYSYLLSILHSGNYLSSFLTFLHSFFLSLSHNNFLELLLEGLRFLSQIDSVLAACSMSQLPYSDSKGSFTLS
jgi:hypothetical protein